MKINTLFTKQIRIFLSVLLTFFVVTSMAQSVGIGTETPNTNAVLELKVKDPWAKPQGLLLPKLTSAQRNALGAVLTSIDNGMLVYDVTDNKIYHWDGAVWKNGAGLANTGVVAGTYGTSDSIPVFNVDAQGRVTTINNIAVSSMSDDLGDHTATEHIQLNGHYLSNDGGAEGIKISNTGRLLLDTIQNAGGLPNSNLFLINDVYVGGGLSDFDGTAEELIIRGQSEEWNLGVVNDGMNANSHFFIGRNSLDDNGTFHINHDSKIGIGTNDPRTRLHVVGGGDAGLSSSTGYLVLGNIASANMVMDENEIIARDNGVPQVLHLNADGGGVVMNAHSAVSGEVHFLSNGRVGLGTPLPLVKLHLAQGTIRLDELAVSSKSIALIDALGNLDTIHLTSSSDVLLGDGTFGTAPSSADNLGNHTATTGLKLNGNLVSNNGTGGLAFDNLGNASIGGAVNSGFKLYVYGKLKSDGITEMSDERLKKDIKTLDGALSNILQLRGVSYNWRQKNEAGVEFEKGLQIGLIAQEVEAVLPELVDTDDQGFKSVEYSKLVSVLIEAVKEQNGQIEALKTNVTQLSVLVEELSLKSSDVSVSVVK